MNDSGTQSLKHMALVKDIWIQADIEALTDNIYFPLPAWGLRVKWREIEDKVIEKVQRLSEPEVLKKEILGFVKPIGFEMVKWMKYHKDFLSLVHVKKYLSKLMWTSQGAVDKKKTVELLLKDEDLDITIRYKLACVYCLEDDILKFWNKIPENRKIDFYNIEDPSSVKQHRLVVLWTYDIKGEIAKIHHIIERPYHNRRSPYQYAFEFAVDDGNKAATEYFLQKLTSAERDESLVRSAKAAIHVPNSGKGCAAVFCFLLSEMDEKQQIEVLKVNPNGVLECLLEWPCQSLFIETANRMWEFLSECDYYKLLEIIVDKVRDRHGDFDYQELFREFWQQSPNTHKGSVIDGCAGGCLLSWLFDIKDEENIKLILKDANLIQKKRIIFSDVGQHICLDSIYGGNWNFLEFLIRECVSTKEEMIKFKVEFKGRVNKLEFYKYYSEEGLAETKARWDKFYQLLGDFIGDNDKIENVVEEHRSPAKRPCKVEIEEVTRSFICGNGKRENVVEINGSPATKPCYVKLEKLTHSEISCYMNLSMEGFKEDWLAKTKASCDKLNQLFKEVRHRMKELKTSKAKTIEHKPFEFREP